MAYGDFKDLTRKTAYDKIMDDKTFIIAKYQNVTDVNVDLFQWFISFLMKDF